MENIKTFESYTQEILGVSEPIKKYGDAFELSKMSPGDRVIYLGSPFIVKDGDGYFLTITSEGDNATRKLNQSMFNQKVMIKREDTPSKMR